MRRGSRDAPESCQAQRRARNILAQKQFGFPSGEPPGTGELVRFDGAAGGGKDEQHREIGGGVGEHAWRIADDDGVMVAAGTSMLS